MLTDNVVDLPVFLGEGDAEIALSEVFQEDQILRANGFFETIFGFEIGADFFRKRLVAGQWVARHRVHGEEGGGGDKPDGDDALYESLKGITPHQHGPLIRVRDVGIGEVDLRAHYTAFHVSQVRVYHVGQTALVHG